jgi:hypothetical protein
VSADGRRATLAMRDVPVVDQPRWPARDTPTMPARLTFRVEWMATDEPVTYDDPLKQFRFTGWRATARLEAQVEVASVGFSWRSDPIDSSSASFGLIGEETNGRYFQM